MNAAVIALMDASSSIASTPITTTHAHKNPKNAGSGYSELHNSKAEVPKATDPKPKAEVETAKPTRTESKKQRMERRQSAETIKGKEKSHKKKMKRDRKQTRKMLRELTKGSAPWFVDGDEPQDYGVFRRILNWFRCDFFKKKR